MISLQLLCSCCYCCCCCCSLVCRTCTRPRRQPRFHQPALHKFTLTQRSRRRNEIITRNEIRIESHSIDKFIQEQEESSIFPVGRSSSSSSKHNLSTNPTDAENVEDEQAEPPASVLTRRRALVPPKIPPYNMDSSEEADHSSVDKETSTRFVIGINQTNGSTN